MAQHKSSPTDTHAAAPQGAGFRPLFWLLAVVVLACAIGLYIRTVKSAPEAPAIEPEIRRWAVATLLATPTSIIPTLPVTGTVVAPQGALLTAQTAAAVTVVHKLAGAQAQAGEALISLESDNQRINLASRQAQQQSAEAQLAAEVARAKADRAALAQEKRLQQLAQSAYNRQQKLQQRDFGAQSRVDDAAQALAQRKLAVIQRQLVVNQANARRDQLQAAASQAGSAVELAALDLRRTEVTAPFAGRVQNVAVSTGQQIAPGQALVSLYSPEKLELRVQLTPRRLQQLQTAIAAGQKSQITAAGEVDGSAITAQLNRLGADIAAGSGAVDAFLMVTSGGEALQPGRTVTVDLTLPALDNVVSIPPASLYGSNRAYLLQENDAAGQTMRSVQVAVVGEQRRDDGSLWLLGRSDSFATGSQLIVTQIPGAADGVAVNDVSSVESAESEEMNAPEEPELAKNPKAGK